MRNPSRHRNSRAFATITAIFLIPVVAAALLALTYQFQAQARRTQSVQTEAQLRQLLHAGAVEAVRRIAAAPPAVEAAGDADPPYAVPLPKSLKGAGVKFKFQRHGAAVTAHIEATLNEHRRGQVLRFEKKGERYEVVDAAIVPNE